MNMYEAGAIPYAKTGANVRGRSGDGLLRTLYNITTKAFVYSKAYRFESRRSSRIQKVFLVLQFGSFSNILSVPASPEMAGTRSTGAENALLILSTDILQDNSSIHSRKTSSGLKDFLRKANFDLSVNRKYQMVPSSHLVAQGQFLPYLLSHRYQHTILTRPTSPTQQHNLHHITSRSYWYFIHQFTPSLVID